MMLETNRKISSSDKADLEKRRSETNKKEYFQLAMKCSKFGFGRSSSKSFSASRNLLLIDDYLKKLGSVDTFSEVINSPFFSADEKEFILFNVNNLKEISEWPAWKFQLKVSRFIRGNG